MPGCVAPAELAAAGCGSGWATCGGRPASIPPSLALDDPRYRQQAGELGYTAHYLLIDDNLLDLSHLSFAHEKTLGLDMPQWADERPKMALDRGMRVHWLRNHPPRAS